MSLIALLPGHCQGRCQAVGKHDDTTPGMGKHSLRYKNARASDNARPWGFKTLGHPGTTGNLGRRQGFAGWGQSLAQASGEEGTLACVSSDCP